jgi:hypothetical protein
VGSGEEVVGLLLEKRGDEIKITEEVVEGAARNRESGGRPIGLLLKAKPAIPNTDDEQPIYAQTAGIFSSLEKLAKDSARFNCVKSDEVAETRGRFEEWCQRLGAHLRGVSSLDERLRDASVVKRHILDCLGDINDALEEAQNISHQPRRNAPQTLFTAAPPF